MGDSYQADEWKFVADEYGRIKIEPSTEKPAGGQKPEWPATTDDPKPELPATDQSNIGWRRCNTHLKLDSRDATTERLLFVHDDETGMPVGPRLSFKFGEHTTKEASSAYFREQLEASELGKYVRLGTHTAVDGDIEAEGTVDLWQVDKPLRILLGNFAETHKYITHACALHDGVRSMNPTYHMMGQQVTVASLASSSTAEELRSRPPTMHTAGAQVRGAATYRAPGR